AELAAARAEAERLTADLTEARAERSRLTEQLAALRTEHQRLKDASGRITGRLDTTIGRLRAVLEQT
ncbi:MAG: hypothetical protein LDL44_16645, partial [Caenispirillum sp.]|nr:hypothetical protein [Caenispirillum sp.]